MRVLLRIVASIIAIAVFGTLLTVLQFVFTGRLAALINSGVFGGTTVAAWFVILTAGPLAMVQLWRLRRMGLYVTASLCGIAVIYYLLGALFVMPAQVSLVPVAAAVVTNGAILALLLSPAARRSCS